MSTISMCRHPTGHLTIIADALVEVDPPIGLPARLGVDAWQELDRLIEQEDYWDMLRPSHFARPSAELEQLSADMGVVKRDGRDPLELLLSINEGLYRSFHYEKESTTVDSPIEDALRSRGGVCQDFAHIMIALVRSMRIPCRYVSGYLHHDTVHPDRSAEGATHAWLEALLPGIGWIGFDPTNNLVVGERHIRTAIGRDYADVPPTTGVMKGKADSELQVRVRVTPSEAILPPDQEFAADQEWSRFLERDQEVELIRAQEQQQQQ